MTDRGERIKRKERWLPVFIGLPLAFALWYWIFILPVGNFWLKIVLSTSSLAVLSLMDLHKGWKGYFFPVGEDRITLLIEILLGIGSALLLYGVFVAGKWFLITLSPSSGEYISAVYAPAEGLPRWVIAILLFFITSPAEEIFWRGLIQRRVTEKFGPLQGFMAAVFFYTAVHMWTMNVPLILAAFAAGIVWGVLYLYRKKLLPVIISHALWSITVFVFFPLG